MVRQNIMVAGECDEKCLHLIEDRKSRGSAKGRGQGRI
jgi:hypothetical protein